MHIDRLWDNANECNKQCYQIGGNIFFRRLDIQSNLLQFISCNKSLKIYILKNWKNIFSVKDFFF